MYISLFDLFKVGIGPSSSHTVGPMVAGRRFVTELTDDKGLDQVEKVQVDLYGSLALTGMGHGTDRAILLGLMGEQPDKVDPDVAADIVARTRAGGSLILNGSRAVSFSPDTDIKWHRRKRLPSYSNGMRFSALDGNDNVIGEEVFYSIGGGFIVSQAEADAEQAATADYQEKVPWAFRHAKELLAIGEAQNLSIARIILANESVLRSRQEITDGIDHLWQTMQACIERGCSSPGILPGRLKVKRRAPELARRLAAVSEETASDPLRMLDWVNAWAIAVNEENAAGGRVVTAPTNGAAGIIPAVIKYYEAFCSGSSRAGIHDFFLTATAIGSLYKQNASISGAEVGCQGEVGVACSMAAAGLTAALGGTNNHIEAAAEIGMEHNLGLTCDPIGGLVQIPCIERNAMGAIKAINSSRIALASDGSHMVSLDRVIETMRQTGADMEAKYKETSKGGLAINVVEC